MTRRSLPEAGSGRRLDRVRVFRALGDATRLEIVRRLRDAGGSMACSELVSDCAISRPSSSYHYKELEQAGVITREKLGQHVRVVLNRELLDLELPGLVDHLV
ncbi:MAG TPA: helix-turn-helix domain-containing protein [Candidatus Dormibacteraeota bacterium]|jgi:DNA-binding transcriptional ArsR family regulator|nr:helix-turn-helix domain-containing protein [Candidatus Dormibacteraeota bacterium]